MQSDLVFEILKHDNIWVQGAICIGVPPLQIQGGGGSPRPSVIDAHGVFDILALYMLENIVADLKSRVGICQVLEGRVVLPFLILNYPADGTHTVLLVTITVRKRYRILIKKTQQIFQWPGMCSQSGGGRSQQADVSSRLVSCPRRYFAQILQATLIKWAKSAVTNMAVLTRIGNRSMYYLLTEVSGWWSDVMSVTCKVNYNV